MVSYPYKEIRKSEDKYLRIFNPEVSEEDLKWHWDEEDRTIEFLSTNDWFFQFDNQLPIPCSGTINIKAGEWHRLIKGRSELEVLVTKHRDR